MLIRNITAPVKAKKKILIVNCYLDDTRRSVARSHKVPPSMGPVYLAGAFSRELCDIRLYNEQSSGPLRDEKLLGWPDMLVLTGLTTAMDRMLHWTAYARTKNEKVIVVAGGPPIRALPHYAQQFFDFCCLGDIEEMQAVIADAFGKNYLADEMIPRYDLCDWTGRMGYAESSRNCNFRCSFCSLTGEGRGYQKYSLDFVRKQILAMEKKWHLFFIDNNFYGNDRNYFLARLELLRELRREGRFKHWGALVTNDFFLKDENLKLAREAGCIALFSGVESFDTQWLRSMHKTQNTRTPQIEMISKCLKAGIVFLYGVMLDVTTRPIDELRREIEFILRTPEITLPAFFSLAIPLLGTPYFYEALARGLMLPKTKVRDLNSQTITMRTVDPLEKVAAFVPVTQSLRGYRRRVLGHAAAFYRRYRSALSNEQMLIALSNGVLLCAQELATAPHSLGGRQASRGNRTYISTTEILDPVYEPSFPVATRYEHYFKPTMLTDESGRLTEDLAADLAEPRYAEKRKATA